MLCTRLISQHCEKQLRLHAFAGLRFLCLRQNLLQSAAEIQQAACKQCLEDLYINDNKLAEIPDLSGFQRLKRIEFSYNHEVRCSMPRAACAAAFCMCHRHAVSHQAGLLYMLQNVMAAALLRLVLTQTMRCM